MLVVVVLLILAAAITSPFWGAAIMLAPALRAAARNEPWGDEYDEVDGLNDDGIDGAGVLALDAQTGDTVAIIHGELAEGETVGVCRMGGSAYEAALVLHAKKGKVPVVSVQA